MLDDRPRILPAGALESITAALNVLRAGGLVAFPTDTVYGLAADPFSEAAIEGIFAAKGRDASKAIAVLVGGFDQLDRLAAALPEGARRLAERFWPGALTLVLPKRPGLPPNLSAYPTIGVRMPDHPAALALLRAAGPLATSSANRSRQPDARSAQDVLAQLGAQVDLLLDGGAVPGGTPSTVADCTGSQPVVLRPGPISQAMLLAAWQG